VRLLLDTHALIWAAADPGRLPGRARDALTDPGNVVLVSAATVWEIAIKRARGRLRFPPVDDALLDRAGYRDLAISRAHAAAVEDLPDHHADPFDRMLVAQARTDDLVLLTADEAVRRYDVRWLWA
jgi:PIN domain nuclease of toxin-antitoxin system